MAGYFGGFFNAPYFGDFFGAEQVLAPTVPEVGISAGTLALREAIADLWDLTGELSDLDPWGATTSDNPDPETDLDGNSYGVRYFLRRLSDAQYKLANWKTNRRRPLRFKSLNAVTNIKLGLTSQGYAAQQTASSGTLRATIPVVGMAPEDFEGAKIDVTVRSLNTETNTISEDLVSYMVVFAQVIDNTWVDLTFREDIDYGTGILLDISVEYHFNKFRIATRDTSVPDGFNLAFPQGIKTLLKITDLDDGTELSKAYRKDDLVDSGLTTGKPKQWYIMGSYVYFDTYVEDAYWLRFEYVRHPETMTTIDDEFDLPEEWVDILVFIAKFYIDQSRMENAKSQVTKSDIDYWISRRRAEIEDDFLRDDLEGFFPRKE